MRLLEAMIRISAILACALAALCLSAGAATAHTPPPQPVPFENKIPKALDIPYPGVMQLTVDASDTSRAIFRVKQVIPVPPTIFPTLPAVPAEPARMTLLYPEWLPGKHAPRGAIAELAGLKITAGGKPVSWKRDIVDVYAFHVDVPDGAKQITAEFQFLSALRPSEGRRVVTPELMNIQWEQVSLYPAGYFTRNIRIKPSIILPKGWTGVAAIDGARVSGNRIDYGETSYEDFIDSPMFAGRHYRKWDLGNNVTLNVWADEAKYLEAKPEHIEAHRALVDEAIALYGNRPFDRYEFLLGLTRELGGIGLEHHRSSENTRETDYFVGWDKNGHERGLLPHELIHTWNGKHRRPAGMWTPDYKTPMRTQLLWVYEGQTSYWDLVLGARSGLQSKELILGELARSAARYQVQPGRSWRSVEDTTQDPVIAARKAKPFYSHSRGEDYYVEGALTWLAADMIIRERSGGRRSLDDFAKAFFGSGRDGDWIVDTYDFDEVVATLGRIEPYDWAGFLDEKLRKPGQPAPLLGIEKGGYRLVYKDEPNAFEKEMWAESKSLDLWYSLGLRLNRSGEVTATLWDSPAFKASLVNRTKILAVNDREYNRDRLKEAITANSEGKAPIRLLVKRDGRFRTVTIDYRGGLRYPHLEPVSSEEQRLDRLLKPLR